MTENKVKIQYFYNLMEGIGIGKDSTNNHTGNKNLQISFIHSSIFILLLMLNYLHHHQ